MLCERADCMELLRQCQDDLTREKSATDSSTDKIQVLGAQMTALRADMSTRLQQAEKQRANDVRAMLKASGGNAMLSSSSSSDFTTCCKVTKRHCAQKLV